MTRCPLVVSYVIVASHINWWILIRSEIPFVPFTSLTTVLPDIVEPLLNDPEKSDCPFKAIFTSFVIISDSADTCCSSSPEVLTLLSVVVPVADVSFLQEQILTQDNMQNA